MFSLPVELIRGDRVYLRRVTLADATPRYASWLNDPETTRYLESGRREETADSLRAYIARHLDRDDVLFMAVVLNTDDSHIGNIKLEPVDHKNRSAVLGILIGAKGQRARGIGTEAMTLALRYAFESLRLHRVSLGVTSDNLPAIHCYEKVGFRHEGCLREAIRRDDGFVDHLWMGILAHELGPQPA